MIIEITGGLFSRLDVLSSILNTKHYPDLIQIVWEPNEGVNANFRDLFDNDIDFIGSYPCQKGYYNPGSHIDPRIDNRYLLADYSILFEDTVPLDKFNAESFGHKYNNLFRQLKPVKEIQDKIDEIYEHNKSFDLYGFNIRRGMGLNYHPNSNIMSPIKLFLDKANKILEENSNNRIVVTTDSYYDLEQLCIDFYDKLIFVDDYVKYPLNDGYNLAGMKRTVIDWFLLTKCKKIYCSAEAGFAIRAARSFDIEYEELMTKELKVINYYAAAIERKKRGCF